MKRDMELIRKILLKVEESPTAYAPAIKFDDYTVTQVRYHSKLLIDAGLVEGHVTPQSNEDAPFTNITMLTWAGHEFLDAARDDTRWKKAMTIVGEKGGAVTIGVLQAVLVGLMKGALGLP